jgi:NagD protein
MKTGYLIDMDGVIYRENHLIPGAAAFVEALLASHTPFLFLTNNSAPTPDDLAVRLGHLGIKGLTPRHFYTSAMNTADFLIEMDPGCTAYVIGEGGIHPALHEKKIPNDSITPRYVVIGGGMTTVERLTKAHEFLDRGASGPTCAPTSSSPAPHLSNPSPTTFTSPPAPPPASPASPQKSPPAPPPTASTAPPCARLPSQPPGRGTPSADFPSPGSVPP